MLMPRCTLVLTLFAAASLTARAADRSVVVVSGEKPVPVRVGQIVRVCEKTSAGGTITAKIEGVGKLVSTNTVNKVKVGRFWVDAAGKEFEVLAEGPGTITITVTLDSKVANARPQTKVYTLNVRTLPVRAVERSVVVLTDEKPAKARVGDIMRVAAARQAGPGTTTAKVEGTGKLISTGALSEVSDRGPLAGAHVTEFEVRATDKGTITITCTMFIERLNRQMVKVYTVNVE